MQKPRLYHYVITIQGENIIPLGMPRIGTYSNTMEWSGDRYSAFVDRLDMACREIGSNPDKTYVTFWSFEPNDLD